MFKFRFKKTQSYKKSKLNKTENMVDDTLSLPQSRIETKLKKREPEKCLFHKPITTKKIVAYCVLILLVAGLVIPIRFIYRTVINPISAFDNVPSPSTEIIIVTPTPRKTAEPSPLQTNTPAPTPTDSPKELLAKQADQDFMKNRVNVLLTGIDYSVEREGRTDFRTDTILMISLNFETGEADMLSIPRDSYADIAFTDQRWKINGAFMSAGGAEGKGFECMMQTVSDCIGGIPVNYYIAVEMPAVKDIVNAIGGVWYDVDYEINMNGRHLDKGYQKLDGQAVLDYCRARKGITSGTDIDRIDRQQRLLMEVFKQMQSASLLQEIPEIYQAMESQIYTNLNFEQIVALALFALDLDLNTECNRYTLEGKYMKVYNATYYVLDHTYTKEIIKDIFGVEPDINWNYSLSYIQNYAAKRNLNQSIAKTENLLYKNQDNLASDQMTQAKTKLSSAKSILAKKKTTSMKEATVDINRLYNTLLTYIQNLPPSPSPTDTPEPTPTDAPEPTSTVSPEPTRTDTPTPTPTVSPTPTPADSSSSS